MATAGIYCRKCGYDLQGQIGGAEQRCPECGRAFDAADKKTFRRKPLRGAWWRWMRRTVAALLIVATVLGATWGWLFWGWKSEQRAVEKMRATVVGREPLGGPKLQGYLGRMGWVLDRVASIDLPDSTTDVDLTHIEALKSLKRLRLALTQVTDAGIDHLQDLEGLQSLSLFGTHITDMGLNHLNKLKGLQKLVLASTLVTDTGLVHLQNLDGLQSLNLGNTQVADAGLAQLKGLRSLQSLDLRYTKVTDAGLEHLSDLKSLQWLDLEGTTVTPAGVKDLQAALPETRVLGP